MRRVKISDLNNNRALFIEGCNPGYMKDYFHCLIAYHEPAFDHKVLAFTLPDISREVNKKYSTGKLFIDEIIIQELLSPYSLEVTEPIKSLLEQCKFIIVIDKDMRFDFSKDRARLCPECNYILVCGCEFCKGTAEKMGFKPYIQIEPDHMQCPNCGFTRHLQFWEDFEYNCLVLPEFN